MTEPARRHAYSFVAEIDEAELGLRLMECGCQMKRPKNAAPAAQLLSEAADGWPTEAGPFPFGRMARLAIEYFNECIKKGQTPS